MIIPDGINKSNWKAIHFYSSTPVTWNIINYSKDINKYFEKRIKNLKKYAQKYHR